MFFFSQWGDESKYVPVLPKLHILSSSGLKKKTFVILFDLSVLLYSSGT